MTALSIVVPTFNERGNVAELVSRIDAALPGVAWEVQFVDDDSADGTADVLRAMALADPRVRCIQRNGRRGLSSAVIEGVLATSAPYVAVMDADLQHDEALLPRMLEVLRGEPVDVVVASRYVACGGLGDWSAARAGISRHATRLAHLVLRAEVSDPMSGFFMVRREAMMDAVRSLSGIGFKILLDLFASSPRPLRVRELPYTFRARHSGESKLDGKAAWEFGMLLLDKTVGRYVPVRFIAFGMIGRLGVLVHMAVLLAAMRGFGADFVTGQAAAVLVAMCSNFALNNALTYRDRALKGAAYLKGLIVFMAICAVGGVSNIGIAAVLFDQYRTEWWLSALAGIVVGAVWNYAVSSVYTWAPRRPAVPPQPAAAGVAAPAVPATAVRPGRS